MSAFSRSFRVKGLSASLSLWPPHSAPLPASGEREKKGSGGRARPCEKHMVISLADGACRRKTAYMVIG